MNKENTIIVPFSGVQREYYHKQDIYLSDIKEVFNHGRMLKGDEIEEFEKNIALFCNRKYAVAVNSCTDALYFALLSAGVKEGDEVLVPDFSFCATAQAVLRAGAVPVFIDIDDDYHIDLDKASAYINPRTKVLLITNMFGKMMKPSIVRDFCNTYQLNCVEDNAQSLGAVREGKKAGSIGNLSCLSFDPTKILDAPGCGGAVLTDDYQKYSVLKKKRYHGQNRDTGDCEFQGCNSQMSTITAKLLQRKLDDFKNELMTRDFIADYYNDNLRNICLKVPEREENTGHVRHKYVIEIENRDAVKSELKKQGIETKIHYAYPLHRYSCFKNRCRYDLNSLNNVYRKCNTVLSLPIHSYLTCNEVERVVETLKELL